MTPTPSLQSHFYRLNEGSFLPPKPFRLHSRLSPASQLSLFRVLMVSFLLFLLYYYRPFFMFSSLSRLFYLLLSPYLIQCQAPCHSMASHKCYIHVSSHDRCRLSSIDCIQLSAAHLQCIALHNIQSCCMNALGARTMGNHREHF